jgi:hypothetical protein
MNAIEERMGRLEADVAAFRILPHEMTIAPPQVREPIHVPILLLYLRASARSHSQTHG